MGVRYVLWHQCLLFHTVQPQKKKKKKHERLLGQTAVSVDLLLLFDSCEMNALMQFCIKRRLYF